MPNTKSDSSSTMKEIGVPSNDPKSLIVETGKQDALGDVPIDVSMNVKVGSFETDNRISTDFASRKAPSLDGSKDINAEGEPAKTYISTEYSSK